MNTSPLEVLGPDHGTWQGWPAGAKTMFEAISARQLELWEMAGSPKPAPSELMASLDEVVQVASKTELAVTLERADPMMLTRLNAAIREHQIALGVISADQLNKAI